MQYKNLPSFCLSLSLSSSFILPFPSSLYTLLSFLFQFFIEWKVQYFSLFYYWPYSTMFKPTFIYPILPTHFPLKAWWHQHKPTIHSICLVVKMRLHDTRAIFINSLKPLTVILGRSCLRQIHPKEERPVKPMWPLICKIWSSWAACPNPPWALSLHFRSTATTLRVRHGPHTPTKIKRWVRLPLFITGSPFRPRMTVHLKQPMCLVEIIHPSSSAHCTNWMLTFKSLL